MKRYLIPLHPVGLMFKCITYHNFVTYPNNIHQFHSHRNIFPFQNTPFLIKPISEAVPFYKLQIFLCFLVSLSTTNPAILQLLPENTIHDLKKTVMKKYCVH